jgi:hypothetical protein
VIGEPAQIEGRDRDDAEAMGLHSSVGLRSAYRPNPSRSPNT